MYPRPKTVVCTDLNNLALPRKRSPQSLHAASKHQAALPRPLKRSDKPLSPTRPSTHLRRLLNTRIAVPVQKILSPSLTRLGTNININTAHTQDRKSDRSRRRIYLHRRQGPPSPLPGQDDKAKPLYTRRQSTRTGTYSSSDTAELSGGVRNNPLASKTSHHRWPHSARFNTKKGMEMETNRHGQHPLNSIQFRCCTLGKKSR